jgi:Protein of unknown function (DUF1566)
MQKHMPKLGAVLMAAVIAAWVGVWETPAVADAPVEQTGQTMSFAAGDDGAIQAGHPLPSPRFRDEGDGTVEDKLTDLIWLKDASCIGSRIWADALGAVANLNAGTDFSCADYSAGTFADWCLPNIKELQSLIDFGNFNPALPSGHPFSGVQSTFYWSSTTHADNPDRAWFVVLLVGNTSVDNKDFLTNLVWPVRGGVE